MMETEKGDIIDLTSDHEEDNRSILLQNLPLAPQLPDPYSSIAHLSHSSTMTNGALLSAGSSRPQLPRAISAPPHSILPAAQYSTSPYSSSQFELLYPAAPRARPVFSFSLLTTREFTMRVQGVLTKELSSSIRSAPGARFDRDLKKWIFPIELHDRLQVALSSLNAFVEPLPRSTLAAVLLHHQRQVLRSQPDAQRQKIIDGINALRPGSAQSDKIEDVLPPRLYESLAPFQRQGVEFVVKQNEGRAIIADEMGLGKAQPYSSGILTPTGWKRLGNIRIGDSVTSSQGKITTVTGVYPQGLKKIVKVSFSDGVSVECCEEHLWRVYVHERKVWMTLATSQLRKYISTSPHPLPLEVPLVGAVHFSEQIIPPVNSYQFGLVLGLLCQGVDIDSCCEKEDVLLFHLDSDCNIKEYQALLGDITLLQSIDTTGFNVADIRRILELSRFFEGNQQICIPEILLRASVTSRVKLLSGILDAAGNVEDQISLRVSSRSYSESISELIRSLGGVVRCEIIPGIHCLQIQVPFNPFSLSMKKKWYEANSEKLQPHRYITSIVSLREDDALCISVASPDKLYVTDHYTVTHNTIQAIASTAMYQNEWPVLVFTPSSARYHWKSEVLKWLSPEVLTEEDLLVVDTAATMASIDQIAHKFLIVSYSILSKFQEIILARRYKVVIADESHYFKNASTQRTKAIVPILQAAARVIMLTGTPALSRPIELFPQLNAIAPMSWSSEKEFIKRYCSGKSSYGDKKGASNTEELKAILFGTLMISRLKRNILTQLPPKRRHVVNVPIKDENTARRLRTLLNSIKSFRATQSMEPENTTLTVPEILSGGPGNSQILTFSRVDMDIVGLDPNSTKKAIMMQLFTESGMAKVDSILEHLSLFLDDLMSGKVIVFAHHRSVMDHVTKWLKERGSDYIRIDGGTMSKERQRKIEKFQTLSTCRVALLSITSAGVAITLTAASTVYFAELFWTPASLLQAEDRAHRIGQTAEVNIYYFRSKGSIDDLLWPLLQHKIDTLGEVFEGVKLLDIEQSTPEPDLEPVLSLVNQIAEEECRGTDLANEDDEADDPPSKKMKPSPEAKDSFQSKPSDSSSSSTLVPNYPLPFPSSVVAEPLDERRAIRAARIKLLREQQLLAHHRPPATQPEVISLLDDEDPTPTSRTVENNPPDSMTGGVEEDEETRTAFELLSECFQSSEFHYDQQL